MKRVFAVAALSIALTACAGGSESPGTPSSAASEDLIGDVIPSMGIRVDVHKYILGKYGDSSAKLKAALVVAKQNQKVLQTVAGNVNPSQDDIFKMEWTTRLVA